MPVPGRTLLRTRRCWCVWRRHGVVRCAWECVRVVRHLTFVWVVFCAPQSIAGFRGIIKVLDLQAGRIMTILVGHGNAINELRAHPVRAFFPHTHTHTCSTRTLTRHQHPIPFARLDALSSP